MENRKRHFNVGEVKTQILKFMLRHGTPVKESEITEHLKTEYQEFNRASVNRHLSDLNDKLKCVSKVTPIKKSRFNYWGIEYENLKNIETEFPDIRLRSSDYTKVKSILIKKKFPDIPERLYKKYYIYLFLFPSLFDTFFNNEFESILKRADELWQIENYKEIIDLKIDRIYTGLFLFDDMVNPPYPIIEISKNELKTALLDIQYTDKEENNEKKEEIISQFLLKNLTAVVLSKRPDRTKDQVKKEVSEKIINHIWRPYTDLIDDIVHYQHLRRYKISDLVCKHFYETDILTGKSNQDAKEFVDKLGERIKNVNDAYNTTPSTENPHPVINFQAAVDELDALYDEWYEKCFKKD